MDSKRGRTIIGTLVACVVGALTAFGLSETVLGQDVPPAPVATSAIPISADPVAPIDSRTGEPAAPVAPPGVDPLAAAAAGDEPVPHEPQTEEEIKASGLIHIAETPVDESLETCRKGQEEGVVAADDYICSVLQAVGAGTIKPGDYTPQQWQEALAAAGITQPE